MSTVADIQTMLAYRLGEEQAPSDSTTLTQRRSWIADGYTAVTRKRNWWWLEGSYTSNVNTGSTTGYAEPTDLKEFIELLIDGVYYDQISYNDRRQFEDSIGVVQIPTSRRHFKYYRYAGRYYLIPVDGNDAAVHYIKYWKRVTRPTTDATTILVPDEYLEALAAYAESRYWMSILQQAKAVVPFQEFDQIVADMAAEQGRRGWGTTKLMVKDPDDAYPLN